MFPPQRHPILMYLGIRFENGRLCAKANGPNPNGCYLINTEGGGSRRGGYSPGSRVNPSVNSFRVRTRTSSSFTNTTKWSVPWVRTYIQRDRERDNKLAGSRIDPKREPLRVRTRTSSSLSNTSRWSVPWVRTYI